MTEYLDLSLTLSSQASKAEDQIPSTSEQHGQTFLLEQEFTISKELGMELPIQTR